jgi:hypothetical protein
MRNQFARFASLLSLAVLAAFLVVATQAFALAVVAWITFGISVATLVLALAIAGTFRRHLPSLIVGGLAAGVSGWTIVASLVFGTATVMWLGFAAALAIGLLAVAGLIAHELSTERVVHSLAVSERRSEPIAA